MLCCRRLLLNKDCNCWLHPRESCTEVVQGPGGVFTSPTLLGPRLRVEPVELSRIGENHVIFQVLLGLPTHGTLLTGEAGVEMNDCKCLVIMAAASLRNRFLSTSPPHTCTHPCQKSTEGRVFRAEGRKFLALQTNGGCTEVKCKLRSSLTSITCRIQGYPKGHPCGKVRIVQCLARLPGDAQRSKVLVHWG